LKTTGLWELLLTEATAPAPVKTGGPEYFPFLHGAVGIDDFSGHVREPAAQTFVQPPFTAMRAPEAGMLLVELETQGKSAQPTS